DGLLGTGHPPLQAHTETRMASTPFLTKTDTAGEVSTGYAAGASVMRRAHGMMRVFARGVSRNHSLSRSTFRPTAVRIWPRCTRGSPMERVRRRRVLRVPREMGPSIPARRAYSA